MSKKKEINLPSCDLEVDMKLGKEGFGGRPCDLKFKSDASDHILYMMESDARRLALWILRNTNAELDE